MMDWEIEVCNLRVLPAHHAGGEYDFVVYALGDEAIENASSSVLQTVPGHCLLWPDDAIDDLSDVAGSLIERSGPALGEGATDIEAIVASIVQLAGSHC